MTTELPKTVAAFKTSIEQTFSAAKLVIQACRAIRPDENSQGSLCTLEAMLDHHCKCLELLSQQIERDYQSC